MNLSELKIGERAVITALNTGDGLRRRLQELGFIVGNRVTCVMRSSLKDPAAYRICGAVIAIRDCDAQTISVERCDL